MTTSKSKATSKSKPVAVTVEAVVAYCQALVKQERKSSVVAVEISLLGKVEAHKFLLACHNKILEISGTKNGIGKKEANKLVNIGRLCAKTPSFESGGWNTSGFTDKKPAKPADAKNDAPSISEDIMTASGDGITSLEQEGVLLSARINAALCHGMSEAQLLGIVNQCLFVYNHKNQAVITKLEAHLAA